MFTKQMTPAPDRTPNENSEVKLQRAVSVWNDSGGVGKTTLTINTAEALSRQGNDVLVIDLDSQAGGLTDHAGYEAARQHPEYNLVDVLLVADRSLEDIIIPADADGGLNWDLIPAHEDLSDFGERVAFNLSPDEEPMLQLRRNIETAGLHRKYDYILLDCQASRGRIIDNAIGATLNVVIPTEGTRKGARAVDGLVNYVSERQRDLRNASGLPNDISTGVISIIPNELAKNGQLSTNEQAALEHLFREHPSLMTPFYIPSREAMKSAWTAQKTLLEYFDEEDNRSPRPNENTLPEMFEAVATFLETGHVTPVSETLQNIPLTLTPDDKSSHAISTSESREQAATPEGQP